jgi:hypothetical protein
VSAVEPCELPPGALLGRYRDGGAFADCYSTVVTASVSHSAFVEAFYTTPLFRLERALLGWFASRPSTDGQAKALAAGAISHFAAWVVEDRSAQQLLVSDFSGRTRSWLMVDSVAGSDIAGHTRLYFGSAVVPRKSKPVGKRSMGFVFHALLGFHKLYSRLLLRSARVRILANLRSDSK